MNSKENDVKDINNAKATEGTEAPKSLIINTLDGWASKIYSLLCGGLFGSFFTSYSSDSGRIVGAAARKGKVHDGIDRGRRSVAKALESCMALSLYKRLIRYLMSVKTKVYGTAVVTFFLYAAAVSLFRYVTGGAVGLPIEFIRFVLLALAALPLVLTNSRIHSVLASSPVGKVILAVTGNHKEGYELLPRCGRCNIAFLIGTVFGLATYFIPAATIGELLLRLIWVALVFHSPEFGIVSLFFLMPFDGTMLLVGETGVVIISFILKLILGKRTVKFESVDIAALMFGVMMMVGGVFSISPSSMKPMLVYVCFMSVYFLTVCLIRSREWLTRCVVSAVSAGTLVAVYGVFQYMTGAISFSTKWLDTEMFEGISGRAVSTLENPNVLGEYLIMIIPMAAVLFICRYGNVKGRLAAFGAFGCMCACLIVTWSRGAWLGMMLGALIFCLVLNKKVLHLFWVALLAIPFLPTILPDNIIARITSIGNGAWKLVYPRYALTGIGDAPHSHSLYFQIWVELGAIALVIFIGFLVMLFMSNFTLYKNLSDTSDSIIARISTGTIKDDVRAASEKSDDNTVKVSSRNDKKIAARYRTFLRMSSAAPLCGIAGVLLQGFTDNIWYNYRVYLMFWLALGLCSAYASFGREKLKSVELLNKDDQSDASMDISVNPRKNVGN